MKKPIILIILFCFTIQVTVAQTLLEANGMSDTYELINSILTPGKDGVETPDCNHLDFGKHIDQIFDKQLNKYVFRFHIHTTPDNDRCQKFDRQRNEIKTFGGSPDNLLGIKNEKVTYKWKFKLDAGFQSSKGFTHIHQLKGVDGPEEGMPLFTLSTRKGSPDKLELRYAANTSQSTLEQVDLTPFKGNWVEVVETVVYGELGIGQYTILITRVDNGKTLLSYKNKSIRMWKTGASFIRPKWGVYRSLSDKASLRDEIVLFADFSIQEF